MRAPIQFYNLTPSRPGGDSAKVSISIQRFDTLLAHLPSQQASYFRLTGSPKTKYESTSLRTRTLAGTALQLR